jgi:thioredoxin reductase
MLSDDRFEVLIIGSGPAGQRAAVQAAKLGRRVALIERADVLGGISANTGTLPSKPPGPPPSSSLACASAASTATPTASSTR